MGLVFTGACTECLCWDWSFRDLAVTCDHGADQYRLVFLVVLQHALEVLLLPLHGHLPAQLWSALGGLHGHLARCTRS